MSGSPPLRARGGGDPPEDRVALPPSIRYLPVVEFKLRDDFVPPALLAAPHLAGMLGPWAHHLPSFASNLAVSSAFAHTTSAAFQRLVDRAQALDPTYVAPRFDSFRRVRTHDVAAARLLAEALQPAHVPAIEYAFVQCIAPPPSTVTEDPLSLAQNHLKPAPDGVDARDLWNAGTDGSGLRFVDLELGFEQGHVDLTGVRIVTPTAGSMDPHGTASLGVVAARDNDQCVLGIAPYVEYGFAARLDGDDDRVLDAITQSLGWLGFGDVLLLEQQHWIESLAMLAPIETHPSARYGITLASALGVIVIEPAGNNGPNGSDITPYLSGDSGAIVVGGIYTDTHARKRNSNYGARVDCHALADQVLTCGAYPNPPGTSDYTDQFLDTSAASAIVAGAACLLQSYALKQKGYLLSPGQLRTIFRTCGTPSANPPVDQVGLMPDLALARHKVDVLPDVFVRSFFGDDGTPPHEVLGRCPDIIITDEPLLQPFGPRPGPGPDPPPPVSPKRKYIYVQAMNRGPGLARDVQAAVFACRIKELPFARNWVRLGTAWIGDVPNDRHPHRSASPILVTSKVLGTELDGFAVIAILDTPRDPAPSLAAVKPAFMQRFLRANNNIGVLNYFIPSVAFFTGHWEQRYPFGVPSFEDVHGRDTRLWLELRSTLPAGARAMLEVPGHVQVEGESEPLPNGWKRLPFAEGDGGARFALTLPAGFTGLDCRVVVTNRGDAPVEQGELCVRQLSGEEEVGTVAWMIGPTKRD